MTDATRKKLRLIRQEVGMAQAEMRQALIPDADGTIDWESAARTFEDAASYLLCAANRCRGDSYAQDNG